MVGILVVEKKRLFDLGELLPPGPFVQHHLNENLFYESKSFLSFLLVFVVFLDGSVVVYFHTTPGQILYAWGA